MYKAIKVDDSAKVAALLDGGCDVEARVRCHENTTALEMSVAFRAEKCFRLLLDKGATATSEAMTLATALAMAGRPTFFDALYPREAERVSHAIDQTICRPAGLKNAVTLFTRLVSHPTFKKIHNRQLEMIVASGRPEYFRVLDDRKVPYDRADAFSRAIRKNCQPLIAWFIAEHVDVNRPNTRHSDYTAVAPPIFWAAQQGHHKTVRKLLAAHADPNAVGKPWRHRYRSRAEIMSALMLCGYQAGGGKHYREKDFLKCAELLLEHGANVNYVSTRGNQAVDYAAAYCLPKLFRALAARGAMKPHAATLLRPPHGPLRALAAKVFSMFLPLDSDNRRGKPPKEMREIFRNFRDAGCDPWECPSLLQESMAGDTRCGRYLDRGGQSRRFAAGFLYLPIAEWYRDDFLARPTPAKRAFLARAEPVFESVVAKAAVPPFLVLHPLFDLPKFFPAGERKLLLQLRGDIYYSEVREMIPVFAFKFFDAGCRLSPRPLVDALALVRGWAARSGPGPFATRLERTSAAGLLAFRDRVRRQVGEWEDVLIALSAKFGRDVGWVVFAFLAAPVGRRAPDIFGRKTALK
uniref:Ankyrin repeat protein n=1 Tax=Marseillevirus LCMAC103 TaxID=2506604 RepID=A0A481YUP4_9VIRU|nr:MAG: ankyrin repeat protein [Marseillevirus LCMAC103]